MPPHGFLSRVELRLAGSPGSAEKLLKVVCVFPTLNLAAATRPSGDPALAPGLDPASVTPGTLGFLSTLFIVVLVILLIRDMTKRIRRVRYAAEVQQTRTQREMQSTSESLPAEPDERPDPLHGVDATDPPVPGGKHSPNNR